MTMVKTTLVTGVMALFLTTGCESHSSERTWIDTHPTHAGLNGECVEYDGEPCDDDPHDLDDLFEGSKLSSKKPSPAPVRRTPAPRRTR